MQTIFRILIVGLALLITESHALAAAQLGLSGYRSANQQGLRSSDSSLMSASLSFDIFTMLQLGYTFRNESKNEYGRRENASTEKFVNFTEYNETLKQSLDLTIIPFTTQLVIPFAFGGIAQKTYILKGVAEDINDGDPYQLIYRPGEGNNPLWVWNGGFGMKIPLSKDFSIKVTQTYSEGQKVDEELKAKKVLDTYTEYSIVYAF
jgi:hypothetical protein